MMRSQTKFPYIVLDVNVLRNQEHIRSLVAQCYTDGLELLVSDAIGFEQCKRIPYAFETMRRSLVYLVEHADLVSVARRLPDMRREEIQNRARITSIVEDFATKRFRKTLSLLGSGDESPLRAMLSGSVFEQGVQQSNDIWSDHESQRTRLKFIGSEIERGADREVVRRSRSSDDAQRKQAVIELLSSPLCMAYGFDNLKQQGLEDKEAIALLTTNTVETRFIIGLFTVAAMWLSNGGLDSAKADKIKNDFIDLEYAILGSISAQFATNDRKATTTSEMISAAHEEWQRKIKSLIPSS